MKIGDKTIFGEVTFIDYKKMFVQFKRDNGSYWSKTYKEIVETDYPKNTVKKPELGGCNG